MSGRHIPGLVTMPEGYSGNKTKKRNRGNKRNKQKLDSQVNATDHPAREVEKKNNFPSEENASLLKSISAVSTAKEVNKQEVQDVTLSVKSTEIPVKLQTREEQQQETIAQKLSDMDLSEKVTHDQQDPLPPLVNKSEIESSCEKATEVSVVHLTSESNPDLGATEIQDFYDNPSATEGSGIDETSVTNHHSNCAPGEESHFGNHLEGGGKEPEEKHARFWEVGYGAQNETKDDVMHQHVQQGDDPQSVDQYQDAPQSHHRGHDQVAQPSHTSENTSAHKSRGYHDDRSDHHRSTGHNRQIDQYHSGRYASEGGSHRGGRVQASWCNQNNYGGRPNPRGFYVGGRGQRGRGQFNQRSDEYREGYRQPPQFSGYGYPQNAHEQYGRGYQHQSHQQWRNDDHRQSYPNQSRQFQKGPRKDYSYVEYPGDVEVSKEIVRIVRHGKYKWIHMNDKGYVKVDDIIYDNKFQSICGILDFEDIKYIVDSNDKKRFELKQFNSEWYIKATQGHTIEIQNLELTPVTDLKQYPNIFHGTYFDAWESIKVTGLNRMKRNHIHFAVGMPGDQEVISGMRSSSDLVVELNLEKAMKAGLKFFVSSNNVILCEGDKKGRIHPKFFSRVLQLHPLQMLSFEVPPDFDDESGPRKTSERKHQPGATEKPSLQFSNNKSVGKSGDKQDKSSQNHADNKTKHMEKTSKPSTSEIGKEKPIDPTVKKAHKEGKNISQKKIVNEPEFCLPSAYAEPNERPQENATGEDKKSFPPGYHPAASTGSEQRRGKKNKKKRK